MEKYSDGSSLLKEGNQFYDFLQNILKEDFIVGSDYPDVSLYNLQVQDEFEQLSKIVGTE